MAASLLCSDEEELHSVEANILGVYVRALLPCFAYECLSDRPHTNINSNLPSYVKN